MFLQFLYLLVVFIYLSLLIIVLLEGKKDPVYQSFKVFSFGMFLWVATLYIYLYFDLGSWLTFVGRINFAASFPMVAGITAFTYFFPQKAFKVSPWLEKGSFIFTLTLALLTLFTPLVCVQEVMTAEGPVPQEGILYPLFSYSVLLWAISGLFIGIKKTFILKGLDKTKFNHAFWLAIPSCIIGTIVFTILHAFNSFILREYIISLTIPMGLAFFYSIHHHRFFQFSYLLLRTLRSLTLLIITLFIGVFSFELLALLPLSKNIHFLGSYTIGIGTFLILQKFFPQLSTPSFREFKISIQNLKYKIPTCEKYNQLKHFFEKTLILKNNIKSVEIYSIRSKKTKNKIPTFDRK